MKKLPLIFFISLGALCLSVSSCKLESCINKSYFVGTYDNFIKDLEKNHEKYNASDWESKDQKIRNFVDECYMAHVEDMSAEEKVNFWTKYVEYMILRHGSKTIREISNHDDISPVDISKEIEMVLEDADLEKLFKEVVGDDIEKAVDGILDELNEWGDKIKEWLNDNKN